MCLNIRITTEYILHKKDIFYFFMIEMANGYSLFIPYSP